MEIHVLVNNGEIKVSSNSRKVLRDMAQGDDQQQVVTMVQAADDDERRLYAMVAYVARCPECSAVDVSMEFNVSLGAAIKALARLELAGLIKSTLTVEAFGKQVRRYRRDGGA